METAPLDYYETTCPHTVQDGLALLMVALEMILVVRLEMAFVLLVETLDYYETTCPHTDAPEHVGADYYF